jgi:hypothetical protein
MLPEQNVSVMFDTIDANLGTEDAVLIDTFNQPPDTPLITIREPGWPSD